MKKRTTLIVAAVALGALLTVGGTLAWFTDTETATNVITTGNVDITLTEVAPTPEKNVDSWTATANDKGGVSYGNILPGEVISKDPTVTNTGANPAYVRVKATVTPIEELDLTGIVYKKDGKIVTPDNGYFYCETIMQPNASGYTPFDSVEFPDTWDNDYADATITITVTAEAIQAENLGDNVTAKTAFDNKTIEEYTTAAGNQ